MGNKTNKPNMKKREYLNCKKKMKQTVLFKKEKKKREKKLFPEKKKNHGFSISLIINTKRWGFYWILHAIGKR